jgi:hypothetical protein
VQVVVVVEATAHNLVTVALAEPVAVAVAVKQVTAPNKTLTTVGTQVRVLTV